MWYKSDKQELDWLNPNLDKRLRTIIYAIDGYSQQHFNKEVIITDIHREREEQIKIYNDRGITENIPRSVHEFWRGVDLRSRIYNKNELRRLCKFINTSFKYTGNKKSAILHKIGDGRFHFHIQVDSDGETILAA